MKDDAVISGDLAVILYLKFRCRKQKKPRDFSLDFAKKKLLRLPKNFKVENTSTSVAASHEYIDARNSITDYIEIT